MTNNHNLYPLLFKPVLKDYIWGGRNLNTLLGRPLPDGTIAESWEIAGHDDGTTVVQNGRFAGLPLTELHQQLGLDLIGSKSQWAQDRGKFPLLIKVLDANRHLSVQVHPDDTYALAHEGNELGKTEMWVVLHAQPGAAVILGVTEGTTAAAFREGIENGRLEPFLHHIPVKAGDVVCVPAGSLHAILEGLVIAEIQQNSNTTYRVYDWNRLQDGKPRKLHVDKAMDVINFNQVAPKLCQPQLIDDNAGTQHYQLCKNKYFVTERVEMAAQAAFKGSRSGDTFEIWGLIDGTATVNDMPLSPIQFTLLPANIGAFNIEADTKATFLRAYVP